MDLILYINVKVALYTYRVQTISDILQFYREMSPLLLSGALGKISGGISGKLY